MCDSEAYCEQLSPRVCPPQSSLCYASWVQIPSPGKTPGSAPMTAHGVPFKVPARCICEIGGAGSRRRIGEGKSEAHTHTAWNNQVIQYPLNSCRVSQASTFHLGSLSKQLHVGPDLALPPEVFVPYPRMEPPHGNPCQARLKERLCEVRK